MNGLPPGDFPVSIFDVVLKRLTIRGSIVGTRKDMQEALQFAADGKVKAIIETQPLEEINSVFDRLRPAEEWDGARPRGDQDGRARNSEERLLGAAAASPINHLGL